MGWSYNLYVKPHPVFIFDEKQLQSLTFLSLLCPRSSQLTVARGFAAHFSLIHEYWSEDKEETARSPAHGMVSRGNSAGCSFQFQPSSKLQPPSRNYFKAITTPKEWFLSDQI